MNSDLAAYPCDVDDEEDVMDECTIDPVYDRDTENLRLLALYNRRRAASRARVAAAFAKLDEIAAREVDHAPIATLADFEAAARRSAPVVKLDLAPARQAPAEDHRPTICTCERDPYALQLARAAEYNERRALDAPAWELPDFVVERAVEAMASCKAAIHFPSLTLDTWLGLDVVARDSRDEEQRVEEYRRYEDALAEQSSRSVVGSRWEGEYESYEQVDAFVRELTEKRRSQLVALIRHLGQNPSDPKIATWVKTRVTAKHGNLLRGYCSCLASLRRRLPAQA